MNLIICADCGQEKAYYAKRLCRSCYDSHWRTKNLDKVAAINRRWRAKNPDKIAAINQRWRKKNPDYQYDWRQKNPRDRRIYMRRWCEENPEKCVANTAHRRALKKGVPNTLTPKQLEFEKKIGEATYPGEKLHLHHLVPFSKGGGHTWGNIMFIPASLNLSIQGRLPEKAYKQIRFA